MLNLTYIDRYTRKTSASSFLVRVHPSRAAILGGDVWISRARTPTHNLPEETAITWPHELFLDDKHGMLSFRVVFGFACQSALSFFP